MFRLLELQYDYQLPSHLPEEPKCLLSILKFIRDRQTAVQLFSIWRVLNAWIGIQCSKNVQNKSADSFHSFATAPLHHLMAMPAFHMRTSANPQVDAGSA